MQKKREFDAAAGEKVIYDAPIKMSAVSVAHN